MLSAASKAAPTPTLAHSPAPSISSSWPSDVTQDFHFPLRRRTSVLFVENGNSTLVSQTKIYEVSFHSLFLLESQTISSTHSVSPSEYIQQPAISLLPSCGLPPVSSARAVTISQFSLLPRCSVGLSAKQILVF